MCYRKVTARGKETKAMAKNLKLKAARAALDMTNER